VQGHRRPVRPRREEKKKKRKEGGRAHLCSQRKRERIERFLPSSLRCEEKKEKKGEKGNSNLTLTTERKLLAVVFSRIGEGASRSPIRAVKESSVRCRGKIKKKRNGALL